MIDKIKTLISVIILIVISSSILQAQSKGKISGVVTDAKTKEPLPGANIIIEGTSLGTASNVKGEYYFINLEPKIYTLIVSFIGYNKVRVENIEVNTGLTSLINVQLSNQAITSDEIIIVAERPVIQKDISSSQDVAYGDDIAIMPAVLDVSDYIGLQAGVEGLSIRGGSIDQTAVMIDGSIAVDPTTNQPYTSVPLSAVQEVSVIKAGFNAEYGNIRSGLINITTKDGDKNNYHFTVDFRYGFAHQKHFGPSMFSPDNYYLRPYFDPQVAFTGTQNWPEYIRQQYPESFQGWNRWVEENSQYGLTPQQAQQLFMWTHTVDAKPEWGIIGAEALGQEPRTYGQKPDWNGEVSISGPLPVINKYLGDITFFASYRGNNTYLAVPYSRDLNWQQDAQLKLVSQITNGMKLSLQGIYSVFEGVNQFLGNGVDGSYMGVTNSLYEANSENIYFYWESAFSPLNIYRSMISLNFEQVFSPSTFYSLKISSGSDRYKSEGYLNTRDATILKTFSNISLDEIPWGWSGDSFQQIVDSPDRRRFGNDGGMIWDHSKATTFNIKFDLLNQFDSYNAIKTGLDFSFTNMKVDRAKYKGRSKEEINVLEKPSDWFSLEYNAFPIIGSFYLQDKIELEGMVANLGVRADYFNTNTINYFVNPYSIYYGGQYAEVFNDSIPQAKAKGQLKLSPRLGIAFPIAETAKLFFNYGHFYSYPRSSDLYGQLRGQNQKITKVGNPAALLPRTVAYELGVEINIGNTYLIQLTGYYKDITDQLTVVDYVSKGSINYSAISNQNIADIRGFEVRFEKRLGDWFKGWVNFTYMSSNNGDIGRGTYYEENERNIREGFINYDASYRKPVPQPYARANIEFFTPSHLGILWGDWHLVLQPTWSSGSYYSFSPTGKDLPEFSNNIHWSDKWNVNLRLAKYFKVEGFNFTIYLDASNVFNFKNFSPSTNYGFSDVYDREDYLRSLHLPLYNGAIYQEAKLTAGNDKVGDLRSDDKPYINDPNLTHSLWGLTREINLGIKINY